MENGGEPGAAVEPPDEGEHSLHFTQTDPSGRFGRFDQVLGRGAFKVVYKAFDTQEGTEVAWNQVRVSEVMSAKDAENKEERDRLFAEIRVLKALKHKNIMSFYDSWYDPKTYTVNFITELFTSGTLRQYRKRHKHIDEEVVKRWAYQILCGLVYLHGHSPPIIHRDLKCDNIFINGSDGVVKIGDLGLATMLRSRTAPQSVLGTPEFMAPELYEEEYDDRVDVYSFGMCLLELSTMEYPYAECKNAAQIYRKVSLGVRPAGLQKVASPELAEFINVCISARESRPRARQLLKHPYFDSIRRDKALASSRSEAALAAAAGAGAGGDAGSDYGSATSGPVSRTASSLAEMVAAAGSAPGISRGASDVSTTAALPPGVVLPAAGVLPVPGPPSASSSSAHPLSRTVSAEAHSDRGGSDTASVRSQRSNASELAMAVLENIAEEAEGTDNGEDAVAAASGIASPGAAAGSQQASKGATPQGSPRLAPSSPVKPGSPTSSDGCRCDATERRFAVKGDWLDLDKRVQLRLRICEPSGTARTVEFEFDLMVDTATNVAAEMVSDLELTPEDAAVIASTIRAELARLSALPEIHPAASMSLAQAAQAFERQLTVNALEQAHNSTGSTAPHHERNASFGFQLHQHGRFADVESLGERDLAAVAAAATAAAALPSDVPPPARSSSPLPLPATIAAVAGVPRPASFEVLSSSSTGSRRPSLEEQGPAVRRADGSSASLASLSSASSIPHSVASQPASEPVTALGGPPSLARASPPPRPASTPAAVPAAAPPAALVAPAPSTTSSGAEGPPTRGLAPPPRPVSPLSSSSSGLSLAGHSAPVDMPSPSQRVVRSSSVDAMSLLTRTSSMPAGREAVASPLGIGSGALSPASTGTGILSPSVSVSEKRIPLHQLFANLEDLKASRADTSSPGLEAAMAAAAAATVPPPTLAPPSLPPLPQAVGARGLPASSNGSALEAGGYSGDMGMLRPRSEACLTMLPRQVYAAPVPSLSAPTSAGALAAAVALAESACPGSLASPSSTCSSVVSPRFAPGAAAAAAATAAAAADAIQRLDLQSSVPVPGAGLPVPTAAKAAVLARRSAQVLSAPPSKQPSRDVSPAREGSLSPTRIPAGVAGAADAASQLNGKRPPIKDKEALRRQAADAMKAVELRSLNLLEGGLLGKGKDCRGVPMAATGMKAGSMGGMASQAAAAAAAAAAAVVAGPLAAGGMAAPMVPPPPMPQQPMAAAQQQAMAAPQAAAQRAPLPQQPAQQQPQQPAAAVAPMVQPLQPQANGQLAPAPGAAAPAAAPQIPKPAVPKLAPPPGQPAVVLPPPPQA